MRAMRMALTEPATDARLLARECVALLVSGAALLAAALVLWRLAGWWQVGSYIIGFWGLGGLAKGLRDLWQLARSGHVYHQEIR